MPAPDSTPRPPSAPTPLLWLGLAGTVVADSFGQVFWKRLATALPDSDDPLLLLGAAARHSATWWMAALLLCQLLLWLAVLRRSELSFAQPLTSLSYVGVGLLSWLWLGEVLQPRNVLSVGLILAGVMLVSRSAPRRASAIPAPGRSSGSP